MARSRMYDTTLGWVDMAGGGGGALTLIDEQTLTGDVTEIDFTDIPSEYDDLYFVGYLRSDRANAGDGVGISFGGASLDSGSNYDFGGQRSGAVPGNIEDNAANYIDTGFAGAAAATADSGLLGFIEVTVYDYADTSQQRYVKLFAGRRPSNTDIATVDGLGTWRDTTDAIQKIRLVPTAGTNWVSGSTIKLYGVTREGSGSSSGLPADSWLANLFTRPSDETVHAYDDEYNDETIDAAWTLVQPSGSQSIVEKSGLMSIRMLTTFTVSDMAAYMKVLDSLSFPLTVEVAVRVFTGTAGSDHAMMGPMFSDGATTTDEVFMTMAWPTAGNWAVGGRDGTFTAMVNSITTLSISAGGESNGMMWYYRVIWSAADEFKCGFSPDGVNWIYSAAYAKTFTPTHFGFGWSSWADDPDDERWVTYEYFRVTEADLSL